METLLRGLLSPQSRTPRPPIGNRILKLLEKGGRQSLYFSHSPQHCARGQVCHVRLSLNGVSAQFSVKDILKLTASPWCV